MTATISVRQATEADIPRLVELGRMMQAESAIAYPPVEPGHASCRLAEIMASNGVVFIADVGALVGLYGETMFSTREMASIVYFFVEKPHRSLPVVRAFLDRFEEWAGDVPIMAGFSTGMEMKTTERLMRLLGFEAAGMTFMKVPSNV